MAHPQQHHSRIKSDSPPTKTLTNPVRKHHQMLLKNTMTAESMSIHLSTSGVGAGAWLHAIVDGISFPRPVSILKSLQTCAVKNPKRHNNPHTAKHARAPERATTTYALNFTTRSTFRFAYTDRPAAMLFTTPLPHSSGRSLAKNH